MLRVLKNKFLKLGRDEDGVAFVTTLAVFMFMYLVCMGVYAIGTAVKTRIHLQNACDAAAYSAAVVQADTLSRIATINRAMSWTYVAMTRRQMDYVTYRWLDEVNKHWRDDNTQTESWAGQSTAVCSNPLHHGLDFDCSSITLYGAHNITPGVTADGIGNANSEFLSRWVGGDASFYADRDSMTGQIDADRDIIRGMGKAIDDLVRKYHDRADAAAKAVLSANVPPGTDVGEPFVKVEEMASYIEELPNTAEDEERFLGYARCTSRKAFGNGGLVWFVRKATSDDTGFRRGYDFGGRILCAEWTWYSNKWKCKKASNGSDIHIGPYRCTTCAHPSHERCSCLPGPSFHAYVYADNAHSRDLYYETPDSYKARPVRIRQNYFDKSGTITVGVAAKNQNPWFPIFRTAVKGMFSAFNIGGDLPWTPQYTVCFASAKAGYKNVLNWENRRHIETDIRNYRIDWQDEEGWNLFQSDWDAVLIPVRRAESSAEGGGWSGNVGNFLGLYAHSLVDADRMRAGGDGLDVAAVYNGRDLGEEYRFGNQTGFWGGKNPPRHPESNGVRAKWQIGNPNKPIDWAGLQKVMFH